ncbi:agamous-like MADS-box protein AGL61 [Salvia miltiorrhiza]|uniref:agamous-like MADS-box protein AGL61 n=1 Tax=Salvia miltiorrhiza TaxID=226208 RepID=UPI0025ABAE4A|nr:agamous-like MADS-box protein AGL61 [Salvia miltiorrhiza]
MSERKTRGRQRIPIRLIEKKDDLLVSFSKRRVGVYKKVSELSTLCGVDVGAIIFSPSGIPHSFFTPDFDSVVYGRRNAAQKRDDNLNGSPRTRIRELNKRLDEVVEKQEREEKREKQLGGGAEMGWWEVPVESLNGEQVKEQIEWFQALRAQIKSRVQELKNGTASSPPEDGDGALGHVSGECSFAPPASLDAYAGNQNPFPLPPPPPPHFDGGGGSSVAADRYHFAACVGGGSGQYCYPAASLNMFEQYLQPPSPLRGGISQCLGDKYGYLPQAQGYGEPGPSHRTQK